MHTTYRTGGFCSPRMLVAMPAGGTRRHRAVVERRPHGAGRPRSDWWRPRTCIPTRSASSTCQHYPPIITATIEVPGSVVGPPTAAWIAKNESWAIVTSATKADPQAKDGIAPDDRVSVIDLTSKPPKIQPEPDRRRWRNHGAGLAGRQACADRQPNRGHGLGVHRREQATDPGRQDRPRQQELAAERHRVRA